MTNTRFLRIFALILCLLPIWAEAFPIAPYFPLTPGATWTYNKNGVSTATATVLQGTVPINGTATRAIAFSDTNDIEYYTNIGTGVLGYGAYSASEVIDGCGTTSVLVTFSPPFRIAPADVSLGGTYNTSGTANGELYCPSKLTLALTYSTSSTVVGFETVTTPAGIFQALKISTNTSISYNSQYFDSTSLTVWLANGIGPIKDQDNTDTSVLSSTSIVRTTPDPISFTNVTGATPGSAVTSTIATITGTTAASPINISGGAYRINGGAWTTNAGTISNGQTVQLQVTAAASAQTASTTVNIGGVASTFAVTSLTNQTLTFGVLSNKLVTANPFTVSATSSSGLTVVFSSLTPSVCTVSGTNGSTITLVSSGTCTLAANQTGNGTYAAATQVTQSFAVISASAVSPTLLLSASAQPPFLTKPSH